MREADFDEFAGILDTVSTMLSRGRYVPDDRATTVWFRSLAAHDMTVVRAAFDAHVSDPDRGRFVPAPADILARIVGAAVDDGRMGPEEAWALALSSADERETVVWSLEASEAFAAARPVLDAGDKVGARMAFRETYDRLVAAARRAGRGVEWSVSLGTDVDRRALALAAAARAGRLTGTEHDLPLLPAPSLDALLLSAEGLDADVEAEAAAARAAACATLRALSARLRAGAKDAPSPDAAARAETQRRQAEAAELSGIDADDARRQAAGFVSPAELEAIVHRVRRGGRP